MMHNSLNIKTAVAYIPYQDLENKHMLLGLLDQPNNFVSHLRRYANSLTTQMVFGFRTLSTEDPRLLQFFKACLHHFLDHSYRKSKSVSRVSKNGVSLSAVRVLSSWIFTPFSEYFLRS